MTYLSNLVEQFRLGLSASKLFSVRKTIVVPVMLSILTLASGCGSDSEGMSISPTLNDSSTTTNELAELQSAQAKWDSHSGQFYTIESQRFCECVAEMSAQMKISVSDNSVLSAFDISSDEAISKEIREEIKTIDSLFTLIEEAITDGVSIEVTYNEVYGYPETAKIDLEKLAVDGGLYITLSNLEIKNSLLALNDVVWTLGSFDSIAGPQPIIEKSTISLSIDMQNMQFNGVAGCNHYSADFVLDSKNNDISISNIISTEMACSEPENIMQQEQSYLATLAQVRFFTFSEGSLNLVVGGDSGLQFVVAQYAVEIPVTENMSTDSVSLQRAKTKWNSYSEQYYTIQSQRYCECEDEAAAQMEINVLDNSVLSAFDLSSGEAISKETQQEIQTIDSLFALIEKAIADGITIEVIYNEQYGYPETTKIDVEKLAVDGGLHITLSNLEIKDATLALDDITWSLEAFDSIAGPQAIIENSTISLSFDMENMQLSGNAGCNEYVADFIQINGKRDVSISNVRVDAAVCNEPENIMQQEMSYLATLEQVRFFTFVDATLNMVVGGDAGLHFVASQ